MYNYQSNIYNSAKGKFYPLATATTNGTNVSSPMAFTIIQSECQLKNFRISGDENAGTDGEQFELYRNGNATGVLLTVTEGNKDGSNLTDELSCNAGDKVSLHYKSASAGYFSEISFSCVGE